LDLSDQSHACTSQVEHIDGISREESDVGGRLEGVCDVLGCFNLSHRNQTWTTLANGVGDQLSCFGLTLGTEHGSLSLLFALEDYEFGTLSSLLGNLLLLNSAGKVS